MASKPDYTTPFTGAATDAVRKVRSLLGKCPEGPIWSPTETLAGLLPKRPGPLPSVRRLQRMSKAQRAQAFIYRLTHCSLEIEGLRAGLFPLASGTCPKKRIRNARRRCRLLIERGLQFGLWENGRWHLGSNSSLLR